MGGLNGDRRYFGGWGMAASSTVQIRRRPLDASKALMVYRSNEHPETLYETQVRARTPSLWPSTLG